MVSFLLMTTHDILDRAGALDQVAVFYFEQVGFSGEG